MTVKTLSLFKYYGNVNWTSTAVYYVTFNLKYVSDKTFILSLNKYKLKNNYLSGFSLVNVH